MYNISSNQPVGLIWKKKQNQDTFSKMKNADSLKLLVKIQLFSRKSLSHGYLAVNRSQLTPFFPLSLYICLKQTAR